MTTGNSALLTKDLISVAPDEMTSETRPTNKTLPRLISSQVNSRGGTRASFLQWMPDHIISSAGHLPTYLSLNYFDLLKLVDLELSHRLGKSPVLVED